MTRVDLATVPINAGDLPDTVIVVTSPTTGQGAIFNGSAWVSAAGGTQLGNGSGSDFANYPNIRNLEIDYIGQANEGGTIPGTIIQGRGLYVKYFAPTASDSQQGDSSGVFLADTGTPYSTTEPTVGNESDGINQGNVARGYGARVIGHIAHAQAQTGATSGAGAVIDFAYAYSAAASGTRAAGDSACLIRQHAQYQCEDQTGSSSGTIGAAWSIFVPRSIHTQDSLTIASYTGAEGDLSTGYSSGVGTIVLEAGQGAAGLRGGAFPVSGIVQIDVGSVAESLPFTISTDTLTLTGTTKYAHAKYARVAVVSSNGFGSWFMSSGQITTNQVINVSQLQVTSGIVMNATNGNSTISFIKQSGGTPATPSSTRVIEYVNASGQLSWMANDGYEHHISATPLEEVLLTGLGFVSWAFDWCNTSGATAPTAGTVYARAIPLRAGQVIGHVDFLLGTGGGGTPPTHIYVGICTSAGVMVAQSTDLGASSIWTTAAMAEAPVTYTVPSDGLYYAVILQVGSWGTTQMTLTKGVSGAVPGGLGTDSCATGSTTSQTGLPANTSSIVGGLVTTNAINFWTGAH